MNIQTFPIPEFYNPERVSKIWRVPYNERANQAGTWARGHNIPPASADPFKIGLLLIDIQNTFCIPDFELFVAGKSGNGAVEDNIRLCNFIYRNLGSITEISATLDTHSPFQIFHAIYLVDEHGDHPEPLTTISLDDIKSNKWRFNPTLAKTLNIPEKSGQKRLEHYVSVLNDRGKYDLTIWPYHAIFGGIGHALVPAIEEALFFHSMVRISPVDFLVKGDNPWTEHYSAVGPEVLTNPQGEPIAHKDPRFLEKLQKFDALIIAGQAKSHCVAWTINDLLAEILTENVDLVRKVYLLEDCTSPVVVPGIVDYTDQADAAFQRFRNAGMHVVQSTEPMESWLKVEFKSHQ